MVYHNEKSNNKLNFQCYELSGIAHRCFELTIFALIVSMQLIFGFMYYVVTSRVCLFMRGFVIFAAAYSGLHDVFILYSLFSYLIKRNSPETLGLFLLLLHHDSTFDNINTPIGTFHLPVYPILEAQDGY